MLKNNNNTRIKAADGGINSLIVILPVFLLLLLRFLSIGFPDARMWGFNHLIFLPIDFTYYYAIACLVVVLAFIPPFRNRLVGVFKIPAGIITDPSRKLWWFIVAGFSMVIFWLAAMPTNFLGDGYLLLNNIGDKIPVIYKWSEIGALKVGDFVYKLIPYDDLAGARYAYAIISVISGGTTLFFFMFIAAELEKDSLIRFFIFLVLLFSGWTLLFFGYVENYPVLWPFMSAYICFSIRLMKNKNSIVVPSLMLLSALLLHLQALFFLPSFLVLLFSGGRGKRIYRKHRNLIWLSFGVVAVAGITLFFVRYNQSVDFRNHFLPLLKGRPATPDYAVFSKNHLIDLLNQSILLVPLWPVLLIAGRKKLPGIIRRKQGLFLLLFSTGAFLFITMVDPKVGMGRDWDLFALTGLAPIILLSISAIAGMNNLKKLIPGLLLFSLVFVSPYFLTNLRYQSSIDYYVWLQKLDLPKTRNGLIVLREYYKDTGQAARADSLDNEIKKFFPHVALSRRAVNLVRAGRITEGMALADSIFRTDPYSAESYDLMGAVHYMQGDYNKAIEYYKKAANLMPYNPEPKTVLGGSYRRLGMTDKALEYFRQAQRLSPEYPRMLEGLMLTFYDLGQYDSSFAYGRNLAKYDSLNRNVHLVIGVSAYRSGDRSESEKNLERYLQMAPPAGPDRDLAEDLLGRLR